MTERVYVHVGAPKSGTTYLQQVLETNRRTLADAGVLVVGEEHVDLVHAGMVVREDPRLDKLPPRARQAWSRLVEQVRDWSGPSAILSYELLGGASAEQVRRALGDLDGLEVHVVVSARDFAKAVPSAWQEKLKFAFTQRLEDWTPRPEEDGPRAEWGWRTMDPAGVAARWGADLPAGQVHVVTAPRAGAPRDELWRRFATACGLQDVPGLRTDVPRANESLGLVAAELLRRVNEQVGAPISGNREQALWIRDTLAHGVLAGLGKEPIGLTEEQLADARERSAESIEALRGSGYDIQGDLEDLRAGEVTGRTPGQATDSELLDVAVRAIVRLLLLVRERTGGRQPARPAPAAAPAAQGVKSRIGRAGKNIARAATRPVRAENQRLQERVAELEAQVQESRRLQLRVAELADVVSELLVPAALRDDEVTRAAVQRYRKESL